MQQMSKIGDEVVIVVDSEIVRLGPDNGSGDRPTPVGYCRMVDGSPCSCTVAWVNANGNCPCAPNDASNPVCKRKA